MTVSVPDADDYHVALLAVGPAFAPNVTIPDAVQTTQVPYPLPEVPESRVAPGFGTASRAKIGV